MKKLVLLICFVLFSTVAISQELSEHIAVFKVTKLTINFPLQEEFIYNYGNNSNVKIIIDFDIPRVIIMAKDEIIDIIEIKKESEFSSTYYELTGFSTAYKSLVKIYYNLLNGKMDFNYKNGDNYSYKVELLYYDEN